MESVDQQMRQQKENYEHMTEGELCALAEDAYDLTEIAREALQAVLSERGIAVRFKLEPPPPAEPPEDEGLINLAFHGWPCNAEQARLTMGALSAAGIPSFLGPDNVMHLEEFRGSFDVPVSLKVRDVDREHALLALQRVSDAFWGDNKDPDEEKDYAERGIAVRLKLEPPPPAGPPEDEGLINLGSHGWMLNAHHAWHTMGTLSAAGIPSFLGPDNVMHLEEFRGRFDGPVSLKIRDVDREHALLALQHELDAFRRDNKDPDEEDEWKAYAMKDYAILCPKCRSAKVVLERRDSMLAEPPPTAWFQWSCDACGHQWVDEGFVQEVAGGQSWPGEEFPSREEDSAEESDPK